MPQNFLACDRDQELLLPPNLRDWLPDDHFVEEVVAQRRFGLAAVAREPIRVRPFLKGIGHEPQSPGPSFGEYTFVRTIYDSPMRGPGGRRYYGQGTWTTDYPEADNNFTVGLREWAGTNLKIAPRPEQIEIMDDRIFVYP